MRTTPVVKSSVISPILLEPATAQPFVKWVGGKRYLLDKILALAPLEFSDYFEPFVGGGAVLFSMAGKAARMSVADTNLELILAYKAIQKEPGVLIERLKRHASKH